MKPLEHTVNRPKMLALVFLPLAIQVFIGVSCIRRAFGEGTDHRGYPHLADEGLGVSGYFMLVAAGVLLVVWIALPKHAKRFAPILTIGSAAIAATIAAVKLLA